MKADHHIVYAVARIDIDLGAIHVKRRVSRELPWCEAIDRWDALDRARREAQGVSLRRTPVSYLAVRAADDPAWPALDRARTRPRDTQSGRFI
jgi:hypothetical protein